MPDLFVDDKKIKVKKGTVLLTACLENGIYIPNLCHIEGIDLPFASCRLCFVEIKGFEKPVTACTVIISDDMVVNTDTPEVRQLQRTALNLILSEHDVDCGHCYANKKCELQRISKFLKVRLKPGKPEHIIKGKPHSEHPYLLYNPNRCVLCGKCIFACNDKNGQSFLTFAGRGSDTVISLSGSNDTSYLVCRSCTACSDICPVGALERTTSAGNN